MLSLSVDIWRPVVSGQSLTAQVQALFAGGEKGFIHDASDIATLYQDTAATIPVTALEQNVKRINDISGNAADALWIAGTPPRYTKRHNQLLATDAFDHASWTRTGSAPTVTPNAALDPFGVMIADQLAFSASGSGNRLSQISTGNSELNTVSVYLKGTVGGEQIRIWNGWSDQLTCTLTTSWQRFSLPETTIVSSTGLYIYALSGTPTVYAAGAQVNAGTAASAYQAVDAAGAYSSTGSPPFVFISTATITTTFGSSLGSACTVAWATPRVGVRILTAQTIGTSYTDTNAAAAKLVIDRALTAPETALVTAWLTQKAMV